MPRREIVDFSLPTFVDGAGVISRTGKPVRYFEDLGGKRIGVLGGTTSEAILRKALDELNLKATIVLAPDHRAGLDLLSDDKVDAYFADRGIIAAMLQEGGRPGFAISNQYFSYETYALALPATMVRSGCWSTARWPGFIAPARSTRSCKRHLARRRPTSS